jgi:uncharacterized protein
MNTNDLVLAVLANEPKTKGHILGRTLLQKKLFFLKELTSAQIRFLPHYYGPYSREIAETVDSLVSAGFIIERAESYPSMRTPWGETTRYSYELSSKVQDNIDKLLVERLGGKGYSKIQNSLKKINSLPESGDYKLLSLAAKVLQILNEKRQMRVNDFPREARKLNWDLRAEDVRKASVFLKNLGLLKEAKQNSKDTSPSR